MSNASKIEPFKIKIIDSTLLIGTVIGFLTFAIAYIPDIGKELRNTFYSDGISFIILFAVYRFRKKIQPVIKAFIVILILLGFVINDELYWGVHSLNATILVIIPFYALFVFNFNKSILIFVFSLIIYLGISFLQLSGVLEFDPSIAKNIFTYDRSIETALIVASVGFIIMNFTKKYINEVTALIADLESKNNELAAREKSLEREQIFTNGLLDSLPGIFNLFKKTQGGFELVKWNKNTLDVSGLSENELQGQNPDYLIHPDYTDALTEVIKSIEKGNSDGFKAKSNNINNPEKSSWFYFTAHPLTYDNEAYVIALGIDISEQKIVEESFQKEKDFSDKLLEIIPGMFYMYEKKGSNYNLVKWNQNHEKLTGYSGEELNGMSPLDFFSEDYQKPVSDTINKLDYEEVVTLEAPIIKKNGPGDYYYFITQKAKVAKKEFFIGIGLNIEDRKVMERELEHRNLNLKDMLDDMQLRNKKLAEYAFINSHLLRAPLVRILGLAELVSKEVILSEHQELLESFKTSADELDAIVSKINETLDQRRDLNREDILDAIKNIRTKDKENSSEK
ncbi:MAG: PAS domain S-box protein [Reichenbachiella sp.]